MPLRVPGQPAPATYPAATGGLRIPTSAPAEPETALDADEGPGAGSVLAGMLGLGAAGLVARNPKAAIPAVRKGLEYANAARQQMMLSGFAPIKSLLGNVGAAAAASAERRSLTPLKELLSMQTARDVKAAYKAGKNIAPSAAAGVNIPGPTPGRIMGAFDEATQKALQRAGLSPQESARATFQSPLGENYGPFAKVLDSPAADYIVPFRRTPFNQFAEGWKTMQKGTRDLPVLAGYSAAGAAHGALTEDERYPVSIPFGIAAAAKYGLPYGLAAIAGRILAGGEGAGNTAGSVLPVSEYGITQSIEEPLAPFTDPSFLRALTKLREGL